MMIMMIIMMIMMMMVVIMGSVQRHAYTRVVCDGQEWDIQDTVNRKEVNRKEKNGKRET